MSQLTPPAQGLVSAINRIVAGAKQKKKGTGFLDPGIQDKLKSMSAADMLNLDPPSTEAGLWTSDLDFCKRLGASVFGVSPETVDELPWTHLIFLQQVVTVNFIFCLEDATH